LASAETKIADVSKLSFENERQSALIKKLTRDIEGLKQAGITKDDTDLAKNFAKLRDANAQLLYENNALKVSIEEQRKRADDFKEELAKQAEAINALASAKRNHSMEMNMRLYKYKLQLDSHLGGAVNNLQEIEKFLESLKSDTAQMYESTKINIDL
jgi:archaellum component FlaC